MKSSRIAKLPVAMILFSLGVFASISLGCAVVAQSDNSGGSSVADVRIGVLGLFRPTQFTVTASGDSALVLRTDEEQIVLEKSSGVDSASIRASGKGMEVSVGPRVVRASKLAVSGRNARTADFILAVPNKITRRYHGTLEIKSSAGTLSAIVAMNRETAVASVVAAENPSDTPFEALKAQAVAARSYFVASRGRHHDFDFCDTTHCQFLREPPPPGERCSTSRCGHPRPRAAYMIPNQSRRCIRAVAADALALPPTWDSPRCLSLLLGRVPVLPVASISLVESNLRAGRGRPADSQ